MGSMFGEGGQGQVAQLGDGLHVVAHIGLAIDKGSETVPPAQGAQVFGDFVADPGGKGQTPLHVLAFPFLCPRPVPDGFGQGLG